MKKVMLFLLVTSLAAFGQHGRSGGAMGGMHGGMPMGGPSSGMGSSGHGLGGSHNTAGPNQPGQNQSGPKSPDQMLQQNTKLASKLKDLGVDSCSGFKNLGQCVAAAHVAKNLKIPFDQLKTTMTDGKGMSLGGAIQTLDPQANAKAEAKKGNQQAHADIQDSKS